MTMKTASICACQDMTSKTQQEVNLAVIMMEKWCGPELKLSQRRWGTAAWSACAFLNAERLLQSLCWVCYPDIDGCRHAAASCPDATRDGLASYYPLSHSQILLFMLCQQSLNRGYDLPKLGYGHESSWILTLINHKKGWSIHQGWNMLKGTWWHV